MTHFSFSAPRSRGIALVESIVAISLFALALVAFLDAANVSAGVASGDKTKAAAAELLFEKIDAARLVPYANVGVVGGMPSGTLAATEQKTINGFTYTVTTTVAYIDDAGDGTGGSDQDSQPQDYKSMRITISWTGPKGAQSISTVLYRAPGT